MAELPDLGQHCSLCSNLDFLPIVCVHCENIFCKDHLTSHQCATEIQIETPADENKKKSTDFIKCHFCSTSVPILESSCCTHCTRRFCLIHRHQPDHECEKLNQHAEKTQVISNPGVEKILAKIRSEYKPGINLKNRGNNKNNPLALKIALMKLKSHGIGLESIPMEEREYFYLSFIPGDCCYSQESKAFRDQPIFLCKEWSIGKVVDWIAEKWCLVNKNNQPDKPKLVLFKEELLVADGGNDRKCCQNPDDYLCFSHFIKDLISEKILTTANSLIVTYLADN